MNKIKKVFSKKPTNEHDLNRICSTPFLLSEYGDDGVALIGQNLAEFAKLASNFNCRLVTGGIYGCSVYIESVAELALVDKRDRSAEAMTAIHELIWKKRIEKHENDRMTNKQIVETMKKMDDKLISLNRLSTLQTQMANLQQQVNSIKIKTVSTELPQTIIISDNFYTPKYLENAKSSPEFMEKLCVQLSEELDSDNNDSDDDSDNDIRFPPFEDIETMEEKKKLLIDYLNYLQTNSDGSLNPTDLQTRISQWLGKVPKALYRLPRGEKLEKLKNEFQQKFQLENTFGTVHICDEILDNSKPCLPENAKLATTLDVPDELAHVFIHINNKDVYVSNSEAFQWISNMYRTARNFETRFEEASVCCKLDNLYHGFVQESEIFDEWFHLFQHMDC